MPENRETSIELGGQTYQLLLNTKATKEISLRYGGLSNLGDKLFKSDNFTDVLDELIWLITLLANQSILRRNLLNPLDQQELISEDKVELLTSPLDFIDYKEALFTALALGTKREVLSEDDPKNALAGDQATKNCSPD